MTQHPTKAELNDYRDRVLAPAVFLDVHQHVTTCPRCSAQCNSSEDLARDLQDLNSALLYAPDDTPYHLSAAEVSAYAQGTLAEIDLEIAESHLETCSTCLGEVQRQAENERVLATNVKRVAFRPRALLSRRQPWRVAAVVLLGAMLIFLTVMLLRSRLGQNKQQAVDPNNMSSPGSSPAQVVQGPSPVEPMSDGQLVLVLNDGNQKVTLDQQGTLAGLEELPSTVKQKIQTVLQTGKLEAPPALAQLRSRPGNQRGDSGNGLPFRLIAPLRQMARSDHPTFRWQALAGAQSYTVTVTDADLNEIETSPPLSTTEWRITKQLKEGEIYSWQVTALKDGARITSPVLPAPQAKFKVIDRETAKMLDQAQLAYPNSHLTLGVLYAEAGLLDEAEQELKALAADNPDARITVKLLQQINALRAARNPRSSRR